MEDLEVNPLYKAFLGKFRREFEIACKMSYLIAIPSSDTLESLEVDHYFANSHILIPSKLLKMHFNQLQVGNFEDIELEDKRLVCHRNARRPKERPLVVRVLAEEIGYNVYSREFRTILIERPLALNQPRPMTLSFKGILAPLSPRSPSALAKRQRAHLISSRMLAHQDDCAKYLEFISQTLTVNLEDDVKRLQSNYIILSHYLDDAARRTREIADKYAAKYELTLEMGPEGPFEVCETIQRSIRLAVENYVVYLMHGKLLAAIHCYYEREDFKLERKMDLVLGSKLSICQLGAQDEFSDFSPTEELMRLMRRLPSLQSPLAMVSCLMKLVDLIGERLDQSVRLKRLLGDTSSSDQQQQRARDRLVASSSLAAPASPVAICSDDLIASFVFSLPRAKPSNLFSALRYVEIFGWSSAEKDQAAYYLATFESAIAYILSFDGSKSDQMRQ